MDRDENKNMWNHHLVLDWCDLQVTQPGIQLGHFESHWALVSGQKKILKNR